jgi:pimeloyl-ACP methyl ester carboxylesterase
MIHGATTHKDSWNSLLPVLADAGYWAIAYDYDSSKSADVAEIVAYARAHGAKRIVLAGSSLGAEHALETADPLHVDAVVNFSSEVERTIKEPLLAITSQGDGQTATYAKHNAKAAGRGSTYDIVTGSTHGIDLVHPHPEAMTAVTAWLSQILKR